MNKRIPIWFKYYAVALIILIFIIAGGFYPLILWFPLFILFMLFFLPALILFFKEAFKKQKTFFHLSIYTVVLILALGFHPLIQPYFLEDRNNKINEKMLNLADKLEIKGKTYDQILELFGVPFAMKKRILKTSLVNGTELPEPREYITLSYKVLPYYWQGSIVEIILEEGRVAYYELDY